MATLFSLSSTTAHGIEDLALGMALLVLASVLFRAAPRLESLVARSTDRRAEGRRLRMVGQPVVVAGFGALCLLAGAIHLF